MTTVTRIWLLLRGYVYDKHHKNQKSVCYTDLAVVEKLSIS